MIVILVPSAFSFPAMFFCVPPLVMLLPAALAFGVQIAAAFFSLTAVLATVMDRSVESGLGFFDGVLALRSLIGTRARRGCYENQQRPCYYCRYGCLSYSLNQGFSPLSFLFLFDRFSVAAFSRRPASSVSVQWYTALWRLSGT
jgi:hypothetical protein